MDDESYVLQTPSETPGRPFFHAKDPSKVKRGEEIKCASKYPKKFLVWQAIDQLGHVSEPFVHEGCMNAKIYLEECVTRRLIPFIQEHHKMQNVVFWPDFATIHYAKTVKEEIEKKSLWS